MNLNNYLGNTLLAKSKREEFFGKIRSHPWRGSLGGATGTVRVLTVQKLKVTPSHHLKKVKKFQLETRKILLLP
jgi:hypothetical protein